jgi:hypothetical protein
MNEGTNCQAIWPCWKVYSLAASSVFGIPFWRHFLTWIGCVPATTGNFKKILGKGSVAVVVGGIAEMYMQVRRSGVVHMLSLHRSPWKAATCCFCIFLHLFMLLLLHCFCNDRSTAAKSALCWAVTRALPFHEAHPAWG